MKMFAPATRPSVLLATLALCVAFLGQPAAQADETPAAATPATQISVPNAVMLSGPLMIAGADTMTGEEMRAAIDPVTGEIKMPSTAQIQALDAASLLLPGARRVFAPMEVQRADGTVISQVDPEVINYSVAVIAADGSIQQTCVDGPTRASLEVLTPVVIREVK